MKNVGRLASLLFSIAFIVIVIGRVVIVAQTGTVTGTWTADTQVGKKDPAEYKGKIHLNFETRTANGHNSNGSSYDYSELQGLSREQAQEGKVNFRLVREAGTIECEGSFVNGKGSGTITFTPNRSFVDAMKTRGFDFEKLKSKWDTVDQTGVEDRLLSAALINVTTALADDLKSSGFGPLDVNDLFKAAIFKVDGKFMAEMKATGFPNMGMEELVKARIFKIDADYVRQIAGMGFQDKDFESLVKYRIFKVEPEFLNEVKAAGFNNISPEEVVKFRIFKVTPELLNELKAEGFNNLSPEEVVKFRIFNIDKDFIRQAKAAEPNITVEELVQEKIGVRRHHE